MRRRRFGAVLTALSATLLAAFGYGKLQEAQASAAPRTIASPRGLRNHGNTCAIASVMQLLLHDEPLRLAAQRNNPELRLDLLHAAYYDASQTAADVDAAYATGVLHAIQRRYARQAAPGSLIEATDLWAHSEGLALPLQFVADPPRDIPRQRREHRRRVFGFFASGDGSASGYVSFADLPMRDELRGLIYNAGGHYLAYVRIDRRWWQFNDGNATTVDEPRMHQLRAQGARGIACAVYQD